MGGRVQAAAAGGGQSGATRSRQWRARTRRVVGCRAAVVECAGVRRRNRFGACTRTPAPQHRLTDASVCVRLPQETDEQYLELDSHAQRDDGCTAVTAVLLGDRLVVAHVGDSRWAWGRPAQLNRVPAGSFAAWVVLLGDRVVAAHVGDSGWAALGGAAAVVRSCMRHPRCEDAQAVRRWAAAHWWLGALHAARACVLTSTLRAHLHPRPQGGDLCGPWRAGALSGPQAQPRRRAAAHRGRGRRGGVGGHVARGRRARRLPLLWQPHDEAGGACQ